MVAALAAEAKTPTRNGQPATATVLIPLSEAERVTNGITRIRQPLPDLIDGCGPRPFTGLPLAPGTIGTHHTLGDAAARFVLCAAELTGAVVTTGGDHQPAPGAMLTALLGAAPLQPLALGRGQRFASTAQRQALEIRDGGCVIDGCGIEPGHCQTHHEPGWADGGATNIDQLALLCWPHHRDVDQGKWILRRNPDPTGKHWLVEPQPRHRWRT